MNLFSFSSEYILPAVFAFGVTVILVLIALKVFPKLGLMDRPKLYGLNRAPIPYYGGIVIFLTFLIAILIFVPMTKVTIGFLIASTVICGISFLDDLLRLSPFLRLFVHFCAGAILVISGIYIFSINLPFFGVLDFNRWIFYGIPLLSAFFTIFWVMTILNAMNFVDGISGISSGVTFIAAFTIFLLSIHTGIHQDPTSQITVAKISLITSMIALAFLIFDFPKARILMGDSGSTFFGFVLATLAIFSGGKVATAFLVLGIIVLDMVWVVLRRVFSGQKIWQGDLKHLHHRLLEVGLSEKKIVLMYLALSALFGLAAIIFVSTKQKFFILIALLLLMVTIISALLFVPKKK